MGENNVGLENIKKQLLSVDGKVGRVKFTIYSVFLFPWIVYLFGVLVYYLDTYFQYKKLWGEEILAIIAFILFVPSVKFYTYFLIGRLNDLSLSKKYGWLMLIPLVNVVFLIVLCIVKGVENKSNQ